MKKVLTFLAIVMMLFLVACDGSTPKADGGSDEIGSPVVIPETSCELSDDNYQAALKVIGISYDAEGSTEEESYYVGSKLLYKLTSDADGNNVYTFGPAANGENLKDGAVWNPDKSTLDGNAIDSSKNDALFTEMEKLTDSLDTGRNTFVTVSSVKVDDGNTYKATASLYKYNETEDSGEIRYEVSLDKAYQGITKLSFLCKGSQTSMTGVLELDGKAYSCTAEQVMEIISTIITTIGGGSGSEGGY